MNFFLSMEVGTASPAGRQTSHAHTDMRANASFQLRKKRERQISAVLKVDVPLRCSLAVLEENDLLRNRGLLLRASSLIRTCMHTFPSTTEGEDRQKTSKMASAMFTMLSTAATTMRTRIATTTLKDASPATCSHLVHSLTPT